VTVSNSNPRPLTPLQQDILECVWEHGPLTADQLRERLATKHRLKDSSIRTLLRRLESQGYLRHSVEGKSYLYEAAESPASAAARTVRNLIHRFWAGSAEKFLVGMVDEKVLSAAQIRQLAKKVEKTK
jgi:predicted transcriptional regulator